MGLKVEDVLASTDGGRHVFEQMLAGQLKPMSGNRYRKFKSPFREEKTPSCTLSLLGDRWYIKDFGSDDKGMDCFDFIIAMTNCEFSEAVEKAASYGSLTVLSERTKAEERSQIYPSEEQINKASSLNTTPFHEWAYSLGISKEHLLKWGVGGKRGFVKVSQDHEDGKEWLSYTTFFLRNSAGQVLNIKAIPYGTDGKRLKGNDGYNPRYLTPIEAATYYGRCLYGEHIKPSTELGEFDAVVIVESEKTAVVASYFYPQFQFLAIGGVSGAGDMESYKLAKILHKEILVLCDADETRKLPIAYKTLRMDPSINVHLVDLYPERTDGSDLADYIAEGLRPSLTERLGRKTSIDTDSGEIIYHPSEPEWVTASLAVTREKMGIKRAKKAPPKEEPEEQDDDEDLDIDQEEQIRAMIPKAAFQEEGNDPWGDMKKYGFFQYKNRYWKVITKKDDMAKLVPISNFTVKIRFHIEGRPPRRVLLLSNIHGRKKTVVVEAKQLVGINSFKEVVESQGNFIWDGNAHDHTRLKAKEFGQELSSTLVDVLGFYTERDYYGREIGSFFAFSNGVYTNGSFTETDEMGIVQVQDRAYYIPCANRTTGNNNDFLNERKVRHTPRADVNFASWAALHHKVHRMPGAVAMTFAIACLFSDHVMAVNRFFPLLFFYGAGSSGKGALIQSVQYLFGEPQDALSLSSNANTDKAKIREMAQFRNMIVRLEEYRSGNENTVNMLKNLWDRIGYKRGRMDTGFGTETVPIQSGSMVTGNDYPSDDALLQRLIVLEMNKNQFSEEEIDAFRSLDAEQKKGLTTVLCELLDHRETFVATYERHYDMRRKVISKDLLQVHVTERMANNLAVLEACYLALAGNVSWPFSLDQLHASLIECCKSQANYRRASSDTQQFWEAVCIGFSHGRLVEKRDFKFVDNNKTLVLIWQPFHLVYQEFFGRLGNKMGIPHGNAAMLSKLKESPAYASSNRTDRVGAVRTSTISFEIEKMEINFRDYIIRAKATDNQELDQEESEQTALVESPGLFEIKEPAF